MVFLFQLEREYGTWKAQVKMVRHGTHAVCKGYRQSILVAAPSLLLATATAIIVTRVTSTSDMSSEVVNQLGSPQALIVVTVIMTLLGVIPGMPHFIFLLLAAITGGFAYLAVKRSRQDDEPEVVDPVQQQQDQDKIDKNQHR